MTFRKAKMSGIDTSNRDQYRLVELPNGGRSEVWFERRGERVELHFANKHSQGSGSSGTDWVRCSQQACLGEALPQGGACFAHSTAQQRQSYLNQVRDTARQLSLRGTSISQQLWDEIVASSVFEDGRPVVPISLAGSEISARIRFLERDFDHDVELSAASVFEGMEYRRCAFNARLIAQHTNFCGPPAFYQCTFKEDVDVSYTQVHPNSVGFEECTFERSLNADGFSGGGLILSGCTVKGSASFKNSKAHLILNGAQLDGTLDVLDSECIGFTGERLVLRTANRLGPFRVASLHLDGATFGSRIHVEVQADIVNLSSAVFEEGGLIVVDRARVNMEQVRLGGPLRVSGTVGSNQKPQVLALRNADAGNMSFAHVDLSRCSFQSAHGLGTIDLESTVLFPSAPWWAGSRRFIADEYAWRSSAGHAHRVGWKLTDVYVGSSLPSPIRGSSQPVHLQPLEAGQVASIYRDLRRSLEAKSDMPGASDFYYGEMEMRRWSAGRPLLERILVWCYWLTSGYGLRPGRALMAWLSLVSIGAWSLFRFGIEPPASAQQSILCAIRATIPGFPTQPSLTAEGQWIETGLRVFGAILLALFLLAARSIVMRKPSE